MKLLLHACCGPCSMEPVRLLRERGLDPHIYFANSNIHPADEYDHRLRTIRKWAEGEGVAVTEGPYRPESWEETAGKVGEAARERWGVIAGEPLSHSDEAERARMARCRACYRLRFVEAARFARDEGFDALGTTLSVSPYQYTGIIREELERACENEGIEALFEDYRPYYDNATRRSREEGLYRQNFCGCRFSDEEAQAEREERKRLRRKAKEAKIAAHAEERAAEEAAKTARQAKRADYDRKQALKRAILKQLREQRHENQ